MAKKQNVIEQYIDFNGENPFCETSRQERFHRFWRNRLTMIVTNMLKFKNLPANLPHYELMRRIIWQGFAPVWKDPVYGLVTSWGSKYGVGIYNNATEFIYSQPALGSGRKVIGKDGVIIYGTSEDRLTGSSGVLGRAIELYADMLATVDVSLQLITINTRGMNTLYAKSDNARNSIALWYDNLIKGKIYTPVFDDEMFAETGSMLSSDFMEIKNMVNDLEKLKTSYLKQFYNQFGIQYIEQKAERVITDEVEGDKDCFSINIYDILYNVAEGIDEMNNLFDTSTTVEVNNSIIT